MNSTWGDRTFSQLAWFKSSYSGSGGGNCVEVATTEHTTHIRDSKSKPGPILSLPSTAWTSFLAYATTSGHTESR